MRLALPFRSVDRPQLQLRRRTLVLLLVIVAHLGLMILLQRMSQFSGLKESFGEAIQLLPDIRDSEDEEDSEEEEVEPEVTETVTVDETPPPPPVVEEQYDLSIIKLTREEYAGSDISRLPQRQAADSAQAMDSMPVGTGPNGELMYSAEWQREPTAAELARYLPSMIPSGHWARIICQTAPGYRVENCQELDESHPGEGLVTAWREASRRFRVRPPRKGGRPMIGAWVRIIYYVTEAEAGPAKAASVDTPPR